MRTSSRCLIANAAVGVVLALTGCSGTGGSGTQNAETAPTSVPSPVIDGVFVSGVSERAHVDGPVDYDVRPPVAGNHAPEWIACNVYDEPLPDEYAVHSMEHGAVWITYAPDLEVSDLPRLLSLQRIDPAFVLMSPYEGLAMQVQVSAWGLSLATDDLADPRLQQFVEQYAGGDQGGEAGVPCVRYGLTAEQARDDLEEATTEAG